MPKLTKVQVEIERLKNQIYLKDERIRELICEVQEEKRKRTLHVDQTLIAERQKMMASIGQLVEATSKAVMWVVAKESL